MGKFDTLKEEHEDLKKQNAEVLAKIEDTKGRDRRERDESEKKCHEAEVRGGEKANAELEGEYREEKRMRDSDDRDDREGYNVAADHLLVGKGQSVVSSQIVWEYVCTFIAVVVIVCVIRTFFFESFVIPSGSMIPTLQIGDYIWVSKYTYGYSRYSFPFSMNLFSGRIWGSKPHRGDVVVFRFTKDTSIDYIKRVIGVPGDHVQMIKGHLYLNGKIVPCVNPHNYVAHDENHVDLIGKVCTEELPSNDSGRIVRHQVLKLTDAGAWNNTPEYVVPPGYYFMMGDNRDDSADSRFMGDDPKDLGFVPFENLVGKAQRIFFSVIDDHLGWQVWHWPVEIRWSRMLQSIL